VRFRGKINETEQQSGRYFLLASHGDPWAQRALIVHGLAGLKESVGIVSTDGLWPITKSLPAIATRGWKFSPRKQLRGTLLKACSQDLQRSARRGNIYMHDLYVATDPEATGRVTIPCIWDSVSGKVVNNESGDIVRILHQGLKLLGDSGVDLYPPALQDEIERVRQIVYGFNAGVYKCGFAPTPEAHTRALNETFAALDACEELLARRQFLAGDRLTECDVLAFPTLIRFDVSYYTAFRCNRRRVRDYPNISRYLEKLYSIKAFRETVHVPTYVCVHFIEAKWRGAFVSY
jgi:putative glutathione S-transferase